MLRFFLSLLVGVGLLVSSWVGWGFTQPATASNLDNTHIVQAVLFRNPIGKKLGEVGSKVDLNNSSVLAFRRYRGLYPTVARKVIENAPFDTVEEVLNIPGLSDRELDILKANLDNFVVTSPEPALIEGQDRINPGIYR